MADRLMSRVALAAYNNARWCDAVCRANGIPGEFHEHLWLNLHPVPHFYPNVVTMTGERGVANQLLHIRKLVAAAIPGGISVKDSFGTLDLAPFAFHSLFEATWLWREPSYPKPQCAATGTRWDIVQDEMELTSWEMAWNGAKADIATIPRRVFLPQLLADMDTTFITAHQREGRVVAGVIAHRTGDVVGISNVFVSAKDIANLWAGCISVVMEAFPGLAIVDYEHGSELELARTLGFDTLGSLRIWVREA